MHHYEFMFKRTLPKRNHGEGEVSLLFVKYTAKRQNANTIIPIEKVNPNDVTVSITVTF